MQKLLFSILLATVCVSAISLQGCKKNDASPEEMLVGKWTYAKLSMHVEFFGQAIDTTVVYPAGYFLELKKDFTLAGNTGVAFAGTWQYSNSHLLTITTDGNSLDSTDYEIQKISGSDLQLVGRDTATQSIATWYLSK